jgi:hypothetical protein
MILLMRHASIVLAMCLAAGGCHSYEPPRTPECDAIINRCMESCANAPDVLAPRENAVPSGNNVISAPSDPCASRCASKC